MNAIIRGVGGGQSGDGTTSRALGILLSLKNCLKVVFIEWGLEFDSTSICLPVHRV